MAITNNRYDCADNSRKEICNTILYALKPVFSAPLHRPFRPLGGRYVCLCYAGRYLPAAIWSNFSFVKTSVGYIITKLTDSTHALKPIRTFCLYEI